MVEFFLLPATLGVGLLPVSIAKGLIRPPKLKLLRKGNKTERKRSKAGKTRSQKRARSQVEDAPSELDVKKIQDILGKPLYTELFDHEEDVCSDTTPLG